MIFGEASYFFLFLIPCVTFFYVGPIQWRNWIIAFFGCCFFAYFGYLHFGGPPASACVLIFAWEALTSRLYKRGSIWCLIGVLQSVLILFAFKYLVFFSIFWNDIASLTHSQVLSPGIRLVIPLGLSFFTFEFIHYAIDVYRGRIENDKLASYMGFIFFFPTMVCGPINRYQEFQPQVATAKFDEALFCQGITRILVGLVKKQVFSNTFTLWSDRLNTEALYSANRWTIMGWVLAFGFKIYFDFAGYSDIAIGSGNLFGLHIPENFNWPYFSQNIGEFWRRWHISLSRWLNDYIFTPLSNFKMGLVPIPLALVITFGISGLWHGAGYNFILWGLWHGVLLAIYYVWRTKTTGTNIRLNPVFGVLLTYLSVNLGYVFFSMNSTRAFYALSKILGIS